MRVLISLIVKAILYQGVAQGVVYELKKTVLNIFSQGFEGLTKCASVIVIPQIISRTK